MNATNLSDYGQAHLLQFAKELSPAELDKLKAQISEIDFELLKTLTEQSEQSIDWSALAARAEPPSAVKLDQPQPEFSAAAAIEAGEAALRSGKVAMILVAGGQGTRLGFDKPKGMFPVGPLSHRTLFQMHCDRLLAVMKRYAVSIPMFVMTSPATDRETREFFDANERCGLSESQLNIFCQGTMPAVDGATGRVLLASKGEIALSPDGHGGLVSALSKNRCLEKAKATGIELFYYAQVDNPMAQLCDAQLLGYHLLAQSQMTTQVVKKRFAKEKVGNVVSVDGKVQIIEYSDLPDSAAEKTNSDGSLKLWAGNIAVHVFDLPFLESVVASAGGLPFHRAHKKVAFVNDGGAMVEPKEPNAIKFERFVFDLLPLAERAFVVEGNAAEVFAPVKNADGSAIDTPAHTKAALINLHRKWLQAAGAVVPEGLNVEIHPEWALDASEVQTKIAPGTKLEADTFFR